MKHRPVAHPYRDVAVIDSRAPRFNQTVIGVLALVALLTGWWPIVAALALQLAVGLVFGRRFCLPCVVYFELVQPRLGEGPLEDARPPRFANVVGAAVLGAATLAYALGWTGLGHVLAGLVATLALVAAATGFCTGCEAYKLACLVRGRPFVSCPLPPWPVRRQALSAAAAAPSPARPRGRDADPAHRQPPNLGEREDGESPEEDDRNQKRAARQVEQLHAAQEQRGRERDPERPLGQPHGQLATEHHAGHRAE